MVGSITGGMVGGGSFSGGGTGNAGSSIIGSGVSAGIGIFIRSPLSLSGVHGISASSVRPSRFENYAMHGSSPVYASAAE